MATTRESLQAWTATLATAVLGPSVSGCASAERAEPRVSQVQLQTDVERFAGLLVERVVETAEPLTLSSSPHEVRTAALRQVLLFASAVFDIATGRTPEVNLLDMLAFVELATISIKEYWVPEVFGEEGRPLEAAFVRSARDLDRIAERALGAERVKEVHRLVQAWRRDNPGHRRVEAVRLFSFSDTAGDLADERQREARGLLASVRAATQSADQGLLMAERALFLAQRMPSLMRLQVRVGAQQLLSDGLASLDQAALKPLLVDELQPMLADATTLAAEARGMLDAVQPLLQPRAAGAEPLRVEQLLASTSRVVDDTNTLLRELELDRVERALTSANRLTDRSLLLLQEARAGVGRLFVQVAALGALLLALFWGGYVVAHRLTRVGRASPEREAATVRQGAHR